MSSAGSGSDNSGPESSDQDERDDECDVTLYYGTDTTIALRLLLDDIASIGLRTACIA